MFGEWPETGRLPHLILKYQPCEKRSQGRPLRRLRFVMGKEQDTRPKTCKIYYDDCGYDDDDICYLNVCVSLYDYRDRVF